MWIFFLCSKISDTGLFLHLNLTFIQTDRHLKRRGLFKIYKINVEMLLLTATASFDLNIHEGIK